MSKPIFIDRTPSGWTFRVYPTWRGVLTRVVVCAPLAAIAGYYGWIAYRGMTHTVDMDPLWVGAAAAAAALASVLGWMIAFSTRTVRSDEKDLDDAARGRVQEWIDLFYAALSGDEGSTPQIRRLCRRAEKLLGQYAHAQVLRGATAELDDLSDIIELPGVRALTRRGIREADEREARITPQFFATLDALQALTARPQRGDEDRA